MKKPNVLQSSLTCSIELNHLLLHFGLNPKINYYKYDAVNGLFEFYNDTTLINTYTISDVAYSYVSGTTTGEDIEVLVDKINTLGIYND